MFYHLINNARAPIYAHSWYDYFLNGILPNECNMTLYGFDSYFHSGDVGYHCVNLYSSLSIFNLVFMLFMLVW